MTGLALIQLFEHIFKSHEPSRDKYISRLFGIFSEEVVRAWCQYPEAPYKDLGRPTLRTPAESRGHTLDFTLQHHSSEVICVAEMKCELEFDRYRYLRLQDSTQLRHHQHSPAFQKFLQVAKEPGELQISVAGTEIRVDGAILIWGAKSASGRDAVIADFGLTDVLSVEDMVKDLESWRPDYWIQHVDRLQRWSDELFNFLRSP